MFQMDLSKYRKYYVLLGGMLVNIPLGLPWYLGNLIVYIDSYFLGKNGVNGHATGTLWMIAIAMATFNTTIIVSGRLAARFGPKKVITLFSLIWLIGLVATFFAIQYSFILVHLTFAIVSGSAVGICYAMTLLLAALWFPGNVGFASSIVACGLGGGSLIVNQCITSFINPANRPTDIATKTGMYFSEEAILKRVPYVFFVIAAISLTCYVVGILLIKDPPEFTDKAKSTSSPEAIPQNETHPILSNSDDVRNGNSKVNYSDSPSNQEEGTSGNHGEEDLINFTPMEIIKTRTFYLISLGLVCMAFAFVIETNYYKQFGSLYINDDYFLTLIGVLINAVVVVSRLFWGFLADRLGDKTTILLMASFHSVTAVFWYFTPIVNRYFFLLWTLLINAIQSGVFVVYPVFVVKRFGSKHYVSNYGCTLALSTILYFVVPPMAAALLQKLTYFWLFFTSSLASTITLLLTLMIPLEIKLKG